MTVRDLLRHKGSQVYTTTPDQPVQAAAVQLNARQIGALPVIERGRLVGIISERDVTRAVAERGAEALHLAVRFLMSPKVRTCTPESTVKEVMTLMTNHRFRHLPVIEDDRLVGIISIGDVVKQRLREMETEAQVLRDALVARPGSYA